MLALACAAGGCLSATFPRFARAAFPPSAIGRSLAASTDHADATRAALSVMASGGNAVDGAIAAALALGVVSPAASGIGGGGFALVYTAKDKTVRAFDFRETAPATFSADVLWPKQPDPPKDRWAFRKVNGGVVGVPGEPAGLELLSRRFGKKSLSEDAAPAVALAQNGFNLGFYMAMEIERSKDRIEVVPSLSSIFLPGGRGAPYATRIRRPELAATLARYGSMGRRSIYEGVTAQRIADAVKAAGGTMTTDDLAHYEVKERTPLTRTIDGRTIHTMPAPSAGGLMLLEVLGMYGASSRSELAPLGSGSSAYLHTVAEAMRGAWADRVRIAGDPDVEKGVDAAYKAALEPAQLAARKAMIQPDKTHTPVEFKTPEKGTSHLVVTDNEGNIVSLTTTVNGPFGASIVPEGTGIILNNELEDFSYPEDVRAFHLRDGGPNRPRPGARPVSSMTPTIVIENGEPILAVGGSGGPRIATGTTQATLSRLIFGHDPNACVSAPRINTQGAELGYEREIPVDVRNGLVARGETLKEEPLYVSAIQMIAWERSDNSRSPLRILAASDPRKAGLSAAR